jgi:hypothetical protein
VRQGSPCARGRGTCLVCALSPRPTIGKEHRLVTPTHPTTGVLTLRKVTVRCQLVVPSSSIDDELPLVKHDARVDLNPSCARIRYTHEPALMLDSPSPSPPPYIISGQQDGARYGKVLIPNPTYKGKGCTELASSNPTQTVQQHHPPPKICGPPVTMEFSDDDVEEEKEELSNELVVVLKQKITALEEQVAELHHAVYDQKDDFGVLRKATTAKLKCFANVLCDLSLYDAPSP